METNDEMRRSVYQKYKTAFDKTSDLKTPDTFCIMNISDIHLTPEDMGGRYENLLEFTYACSLTGADCALVNGDIQDGNECIDKKQGFALLRKAGDCLRNRLDIPVMITKGNHDDNLWNGKKPLLEYGILPYDFHKAILSCFENGVVYDRQNPYGNYYYRDFKPPKIRVIVLNSVDEPYEADSSGFPVYWGMWNYAFMGRQLSWLSQEALNFTGMDDGWGVIVCCHNPIRNEMISEEDHLPVNADVLENILKAFQGHKKIESEKQGVFGCNVHADYSESHAELICVLHGHTHFDRFLSLDGIPYIISLNAICYNNYPEMGTPERIIGSFSQNAFDAILVDRKSRKITAVRFGAGKDKVMQY